MATYVLVHGGGHGGLRSRRIAQIPPGLTVIEERSQLKTGESLSAHALLETANS